MTRPGIRGIFLGNIDETTASVFELNDCEKECLKSKSRLFPFLSTLPLGTLTGVGELSERIDNLERVGRLSVNFPGDLAIEAALAPYVWAATKAPHVFFVAPTLLIENG
ncbi:MAG: hypothetical protein QM758_13215 [Armatimonas sp.]